jgi:putative membrane protein
LADFRPRAAQHLCRTNSFHNAPDLLVNSFYDPKLDEGAAFEEQISFHGEFGGGQAWSFLLYPTTWSLDQDEIVGAEQLYGVLKGQLDKLRNSGNGEE